MTQATAVHCLAATSLFLYAGLAVLTHQSEVSLLMFYGLMATLFLLYIALAKIYLDAAVKSVVGIVVWAVLFRVVAFYSVPMLEDDMYRYLWDGYIYSTAGSPYGILPEQYFSAPLSLEASAVLDAVSYPATATVYGPICELVFLLGHWLAPFELWPIRLLVIGADVAILLLLLRLAPTLGVVLYACNPLLIHSFAFNLHSDVFGVFFMLLGLYLFKRKHYKLVALSLGVAVAAKLFAVLLVPLLLVKLIQLHLTKLARKKPSVAFAAGQFIVVFVATLSLIYTPFILTGATQWQGLMQMQQFWQFNAPLFSFIAQTFGFFNAKLICLFLFVLGYGYYVKQYLAGASILPRADIIFALFFILSAVVNPWYWLWVLVFSAIRPSLWAWFFSAVILLAYTSGINLSGSSLGLYQQPGWVLAVEYLSFAAVLFWVWREKAKSALRS